MKNPNNHNVDSSAHLRRTTYDLSHSKHMSGKIGQLLPVMFQEVNAGETFHWSPNFNFRFAPTVMPIQTRIKCVVDYFFVPMQAIWKDQTAFFNQGMNGTVAPPQHPWLRMSKDTTNIGVGSVGDYLGIPSAVSSEIEDVYRVYCSTANRDTNIVTSLVQLSNSSINLGGPSFNRQAFASSLAQTTYVTPCEFNVSNGLISKTRVIGLLYDNFGSASKFGISKISSKLNNPSIPSPSTNFPDFESFLNNGFSFCLGNVTRYGGSDYRFFLFGVRQKISGCGKNFPPSTSLTKSVLVTTIGSFSEEFSSTYNHFYFRFTPEDITRLSNWYKSLTVDEQDNIVFMYGEVQPKDQPISNFTFGHSPSLEQNIISNMPNCGPSNFSVVKSDPSDSGSLFVTDMNIYPPYITYRYKRKLMVNDQTANSPFVGTNPKIPLSPFGHRSYELCYNFFYRNKDIDPLVDNYGHRIVNQFLPDSMRGSGADTNNYPIHYALLEKDIFTSCFTEPLVNYNPLIGIRQKKNDIFYDFATSGGVVTMSASGAGIGDTYTAANVNKTTGAMITSYGEGIPQGDLSVFKDIIATGITNQDIYSAQCAQRWISNKVQKGYNFSEQQLAQFGVNSRWNPLTAPSYLGGSAEWINNGVVCNTSQSEEHALGELGGMPSCISNNENSFSYKAVDRGFIIGIMRIVPIPIYSQAIHKVFTKQNYTDYFIPEFDNKGYEAVPKGELVPYLAAAQNKEKEAFGYQVPWYDYKSSYDTISGDMRVSFNDSVIMRDFGTLPELSRQFIECHPEDYNDVFIQTKQSDKFIGEIFHKLNAERIIGDFQSRVFANIH